MRQADRSDVVHQDPAIATANILLFILLLYFFSTVLDLSPSIVLGGWGLLLIGLFTRAKVTASLPLLIGYAVLALFFLLGVARSNFSEESMLLFRVIVTSFVLSSLLLAVARGDFRSFWQGRAGNYFSVAVHRVSLTAFFSWAVISMLTMSTKGIIDHREIVGFGYLTIADLFALLSLSVMSRKLISAAEFVVIVLMALLVLVFLGSRTSIVIFIVGSAISARSHGISTKLAVLLLMLGSPAAYFAFPKINWDSSAFSRAQTLLNISADESRRTRDTFQQNLIDRLAENPSCFFVPCQPDVGEYQHGMLSVIEYFGLGGILVIAFTIFAVAYRGDFLRKQWFFAIFSYALICCLLARAWISPVFPVLIAYAAFSMMPGGKQRKVGAR